MLSLEKFCLLAEKFFSFLVKDFNYSVQECKSIDLLYELVYAKSDTLLVITYSKKNDYVSVNFFKKIHQFKPTTQDGFNNISLDHLIYHKKKRRTYCKEDYDDFMPSQIGIENSLKKISEMLVEYGNDILVGKKWKGWIERL